MSEKDMFDELKKAKEAEYFHKKEQELIEKMRQRAKLEAERREIAEATGIADEEILRDLQELGYTRESVMLLHLVPLVQIAWAEGEVTNRERELIYEVARSHGVEKGSPAYQRLTDWLDRRPSEEFFQKMLQIIRAMIQVLPQEKQATTKRDLVSYCTRVAEISGGILGLGRKISNVEKALLERIATELEQSHEAAAKDLVEKG